MKDQVQLKDDAETRFSLIDMSDSPKDLVEKVSSDETTREIEMDLAAKYDEEAVEAEKAETPVYGVTVSDEGAMRSQKDEEDARALGFAPKPPIYQIGTLVNELGHENYKASRSTWEKMPSVADAMLKLIERVDAEDRADVRVQAPTLRMTDEGALKISSIVNDKPYTAVRLLTERGLEGICHFVTNGFSGYLASCPAPLRAHNMNHWFPLALKRDARTEKRLKKEALANGKPEPTDEIWTPKELTIRTRKNAKAKGGREVFAVCGPRYTAYDINRVAEHVKAAVPEDAKCEAVYDGYKTQIDVLWHSNVQPTKVVAGEFFKCGLRVKAADDGSGAIKVQLLLWRNLCLNLIVIDFAKVLVGSRRHVGAAAKIESDVAHFVTIANEKIGVFAKRWDDASVENVLETYNLGEPREVFRGLVENRVIPHVTGLDSDDMVMRLMRAYEYEPGYTKTAFINAITRVAHSETWSGGWEASDELESAAGSLLFQENWNCIPPKEATTVDEALGV